VGTVQFEKATHFYAGNSIPALDRLDLEVGDGELVVLVGPSGSGKSTALRMLAGLESVDSGSILINGSDVTGRSPRDRDVAMVFQNYALYPQMSVAENIGFALRIAGTSHAEIAKRVGEVADLLELEPYLSRKPRQLSGGQRQRVAMGRAVIRDPQVLLMDEPLSNLDAQLRTQTRRQLAVLQRRLAVTTVYVTHDQVEAMTLGDRVAVLDAGVLQQVDKPLDLYGKPSNIFVAGFIGSPAMNMFTVPVVGGTVPFGHETYQLDRETANRVERDGVDVVLGVRPEDLLITGQGKGLDGVVKRIENLGSHAFAYASHSAGMEPLVVRVDPLNLPRLGSGISVAPDPTAVHVFGHTGERLSGGLQPAFAARHAM
jgi:multiple sugar transport system ATP-binding protein